MAKDELVRKIREYEAKKRAYFKLIDKCFEDHDTSTEKLKCLLELGQEAAEEKEHQEFLDALIDYITYYFCD